MPLPTAIALALEPLATADAVAVIAPVLLSDA